MHIEILKSTDKQYYYVIKSNNGQVILTSETYKRKPLDMINKLAINHKFTVIDSTLKKS